jgi:hypothetical protein
MKGLCNIGGFESNSSAYPKVGYVEIAPAELVVKRLL